MTTAFTGTDKYGHHVTADTFGCGWCGHNVHFVAADAGPYMLIGGYGLSWVNETVVIGIEAEHQLSGEVVRLRHDCAEIPDDLVSRFLGTLTTERSNR